jgi:protein-S-isoprenylcysteine O-methyltransferase Ste14
MSAGERTRVLRRAILSLGGYFSVLAVAMFLPAGIGWWEGWLFLAVFLLQMAIAALYLWRKNPDIFVARSKIHKGTKGWDMVLYYLLQVLHLAIFPVAAFDGRYLWSSAPWWVTVLGYVLLTVGMAGSFWVVSVNKFAERSVRIQAERGGDRRPKKLAGVRSAFPFGLSTPRRCRPPGGYTCHSNAPISPSSDKGARRICRKRSFASSWTRMPSGSQV